MDDLIRRQDAIDAIKKCGEPFVRMFTNDFYVAVKAVERVPSAPKDDSYRQGEWDMFELITSAWYGKQYYFKEDNGMAYSRKSHKTMTVHDAILEFIREIGDE